MAVHNTYKPIGISPLDLIDRLRMSDQSLEDEKMTYAGRLDPMADGVVLVLSGDNRYDKDNYLKLDKTYRAEILFGIESDTYDALGIPKVNTDTSKLELNINNLIGTQRHEVPPYASVVVNKKPLFEWARANQLDEIEIPQREMTILSADLIESKMIKSEELLELVKSKLQKVQGDFRQDAIEKAWHNSIDGLSISFMVATIDLRVASGTYIRSIAHELGKQEKTGALLLSLTRTKVGDFSLGDSIKV